MEVLKRYVLVYQWNKSYEASYKILPRRGLHFWNRSYYKQNISFQKVKCNSAKGCVLETEMVGQNSSVHVTSSL